MYAGHSLNTVLNINPNIIIVVDKNYTIRYANDKAQGVFGVISEQIIGMDLGRIFPRTDFSRIMGERKGASDSFILKDMIKREFLFTIVDIKLKGNFDGYVLSLNNTVDIQKNERQVRQNIYQKGKRRYFMFNDIIGDSAAISQAKFIGQRFADKAREEGFHAIPLLSENQEAVYKVFLEAKHIIEMDALNIQRRDFIRGCPACFLILKGVVISSHETNRFS